MKVLKSADTIEIFLKALKQLKHKFSMGRMRFNDVL